MAEAENVGRGGAERGGRQPCGLSQLRMLDGEEEWPGGQASHCGPKYDARI